ncbi:cleavage stimulating factor 64 isoform X2 [Silene latifolia]|uniref:cleavage stimulating factor 64 isoform X2 n=1 Tax=Silene latifolia TaxID=37657 RepID=UPI003D781058
MASTQQHRCVFVGNIPYDATEEQLVQICEEVGPVVSFRLVIDRETGKPKGYGFCEYKDEETALSARRNLQGYEINGRQLRVDFAENDKGSDRNREQGRGGPGLVTNVDVPKQIGGPAVNVDATLHQPIGLPIAMTAASVMAGALGGPQISQIIQNGLQNQASVGNDPLTHHLAKMSRTQLNQIVHEMKVLATQNKEFARQILLASPQLPKALFQAQIMLGMVTPQMLQMPNIRQQGPNLINQPSSQLPVQSQLPAIHNVPGQPSFTPLSSISQGSLAPNQFSAPMPLPPQPRAQHPNASHPAVPPQSVVPAQPGPSSLLTARPQRLGGLQLPPAPTSFRPVQAPQQQHAAVLGVQNVNSQPSIQSRPLSSDLGYQVASTIRSNMTEMNTVDSTRLQNVSNLAFINKTNTLPNLPPLSNRDDSQDPNVRPSKLMKLDSGRVAPFSSAGLAVSTATTPGPSNTVGNSAIAMGKSSNVEVQNTEKQSSQLAPDVESALLQQVLSLTPEQLSSLPPDQQQQVIQLQQMLR